MVVVEMGHMRDCPNILSSVSGSTLFDFLSSTLDYHHQSNPICRTHKLTDYLMLCVIFVYDSNILGS